MGGEGDRAPAAPRVVVACAVEEGDGDGWETALLLKHGADPSHKALPKADEPPATAGGTAEELRAERLASQGGVGVDA